MQVFIGSDHAGYSLKEEIKVLLKTEDYQIRDLGTDSEEPVDYPDVAEKVAQAVVAAEPALGILVCGTGIGMAIAANKVPGVRAAVCPNAYAAQMARQHNNANVITIGARVTEPEEAREIIKAFLCTPFEGGRHSRRVDKITAIETKFKQ